MTITLDQFKAFAAENPDAIKSLDVFTNAVNRAKPKNATAEELKTAFADDKDFVFNRIGTECTMSDHKAAYADHLKTLIESKNGEISTLKSKVAEADPAAAGTLPVNSPHGQQAAVSPLVAAVNRGNAITKASRN